MGRRMWWKILVWKSDRMNYLQKIVHSTWRYNQHFIGNLGGKRSEMLQSRHDANYFQLSRGADLYWRLYKKYKYIS